MPHAGEQEALAMIEDLQQITDLNNQFHAGAPLSLSIGHAVSQPGERLEAVVKRADLDMYNAKRAFYQGLQERRSG